MSIFLRLFGRKIEVLTPAYVAPRADRVDVHRGFEVQANSDIISGYQFCATIQMRTPLRVLRRHGEVHNGIGSEPPEIATEMWEGIWIPVTRSLRELGFDIDDPITGTVASDVGPIPFDGGDYLKFLFAVREAAEGNGTVQDRRDATAKSLRKPAGIKFVRALGGADAILARLFPSFASTVPRMPGKVATALIEAGFGSPSAINAASDSQLRTIDGVGPGLIAALRSQASQAPDLNSRFVDRVIR